LRRKTAILVAVRRWLQNVLQEWSEMHLADYMALGVDTLCTIVNASFEIGGNITKWTNFSTAVRKQQHFSQLAFAGWIT
jgi:hypothetical protein